MPEMPDTTTPQRVLATNRRRRKLDLLTILTAVLLTLLLVFGQIAQAQSGLEDRDCADFETREEAQEFFEANDPDEDPSRLDDDDDGEACETLPVGDRSGEEQYEDEESDRPDREVAPGVDQDEGTRDMQVQRTPSTGGPSLGLIGLTLVWGGTGLRLIASRLTGRCAGSRT